MAKIKSMILIGSSEIKNKNVVRDRIKLNSIIKKTCKIYLTKKTKSKKEIILYKNLLS